MFESSNNVKGDGASSIAQRACIEIGQYLDKRFFIASLCFLHIDDNGIRDLLNDHHVEEQPQHPPIRVREHPETGPFAENATHVKVESANELQQQLKIGSVALKNLGQQQLNGRTTGCAMLILDMTRLVRGDGYDCNVHASHESQSTEIDEDDTNNPKRSAIGNNIRLCLIDLATKLPISSTDPLINVSSLSAVTISPPVSPRRESSRAPTALGKLLHGLAIDDGGSRAKTKKGIPWRDSNTTWLLQGILGRRKAQASLLVTVSSSASNYHQSMVTLLYVERIMAHNSKDLRGQAGKCNTSLNKSPHTSSPETHKKVRQLLCDLKEDRGEIASALFFHTVADPRQRIAKLMGPPIGRHAPRQQTHNHNHTKEKLLFSSSMEQERGGNVPLELERTTVCDYSGQKPEQSVCSGLLAQVEMEQPQNSCITSLAHENQKEQAVEESQENSNLPHNGNASELKSTSQDSNLTKEQHQLFRSSINELEGAKDERKSITDILSELQMQYQTPDPSHGNEESLLLCLYNGLHDMSHHEMMSETVVAQAEDIIKEERLKKKKISDAAEFKRALKEEEG